MDSVYNSAAVYRKINSTRRELSETNVQGTKNLLDTAVDAGVKRFVHCSTVGVHGNIVIPHGDENSLYAPGESYQPSKAKGEGIVNHYLEDWDHKNCRLVLQRRLTIKNSYVLNERVFLRKRSSIYIIYIWIQKSKFEMFRIDCCNTKLEQAGTKILR